jgi:hypothetical protein
MHDTCNAEDGLSLASPEAVMHNSFDCVCKSLVVVEARGSDVQASKMQVPAEQIWRRSTAYV